VIAALYRPRDDAAGVGRCMVRARSLGERIRWAFKSTAERDRIIQCQMGKDIVQVSAQGIKEGSARRDGFNTTDAVVEKR
jgi:hypothetical protein